MRDAAAKQAGKARLSDVLCLPPYCDSIQAGLTLRYPAVPIDLTANAVLNSGMRITGLALTFTAVQTQMPEPSTWLLVLAALAVPAFKRVGRRALEQMWLCHFA